MIKAALNFNQRKNTFVKILQVEEGQAGCSLAGMETEGGLRPHIRTGCGGGSAAVALCPSAVPVPCAVSALHRALSQRTGSCIPGAGGQGAPLALAAY